jgi:hypothetical protein
MKKIYLSFLGLALSIVAVSQSFTNASSMIPDTHNSGGCTGVVDMDNDGLDDIVILDQSKNLKIAYQQMDGSFLISEFGSVSNENQWGMSVADVDNDGHKDVMVGGHYDDVHVVDINGPGDYTQVDYSWASVYFQGSSFGDIDNDGWIDGFVCHDDGHNAILHNNGDGSMDNGVGMIDMVFYPEVDGNDNSGNYGSTFTDFDRDGDLDLFIAKCRQFIDDPYDPRRTNVLLVNDGNNNYSDEAPERGLVNLEQSWTVDFADLDNDGDFECLLTTHSNTLEIYDNDGNGYFTNVTAGSGLEYGGFYLQAKFADFDNDGFVDLVHSGGSHRYFHNNGDMTFTLVNNMFVANDVMHSLAIGDLNHDGYLDLYASYGDGYVTPDNDNDDRLFMNDGGDNNFIVFDLEGTESNKDAIGAIVEIHGPWGVQIREIRAGESYGITNTGICHFGLGAATEVDFAIIHWPAGGELTIDNPAVNTWHNVIEGECFLAAPNITALGGTEFCPGGNVTLQVDGNATNYTWNNDATSATITVSEPGNYFVIVSNASGCEAISQSIVVSYAAETAPVVVAQGDLHICDNGSVILTASEGDAYDWSNGSNTQSIEVSEAGDYSVSVQGLCSTLESNTVTVMVSDAPIEPIVSDITIDQNTSGIFTVTGGNNISWFDSEDATTPIATGNSFSTPSLSSTTTYWVEDQIIYDGGSAEGGKAEWTENADGQYQNNSTYYLIFDVLENVTIASVKVYAEGAASRTIAVVDANNNTIATGTFDIPDGESVVNLNFFVPQGENYGLRCVGNNPQLWRDKDLANNFAYPFNIGSSISITNTNVGGADTDNYYYYFYDWQVAGEDFICASDRVEVQAIVAGLDELTQVSNLNVYPNPATEELNITFNGILSTTLQVRLIDQTGRVVTSTQFNISNGLNNRRIDLNNIAMGIYQLQFEADGKTASRKVVVQ